MESGASTHMVSTKDLNSAELETVRVLRTPTTVITANGVVTRQILEDTAAVLSLGKLCEDHGYSHE